MSHDDPMRGYTPGDLTRLASAAVFINLSWWPAGDRLEMRETAWEGIALHLCSATAAPSEQDLINAGRTAVAEEIRARQRHHGQQRDATYTGARFATWWNWCTAPAAAPEDPVIERLAVAQILPRLRGPERRALTVLADYGTLKAAVAATGCPGLRADVSAARRRFRELWHEGETPSRHWKASTEAHRESARKHDDACGTDAGYQRHQTRKDEACPGCAAAHRAANRARRQAARAREAAA